ncbi:sigma-54-dependent transcriptional regulator [Novipirellula artificiosorum]|uniref:DNA-binding transcriptional regulator NtrC n=1 Tax=Novipirellula artificiosorum TaxID=2528016 RepID=A0A5C6D2N1_9BACT|nr:sigma-54 dependent transcriptional regulator [Novipirellula artificiosorum]TWU30998.1 Nitrogen regulation protein NR(I) [Novipirellula artificiosorum]
MTSQEDKLVLVVDDEPSICWAFQKMLQQQGHRVITASSAEEGLRLAEEQKPDMVVLDVRLPKEDGITALPKFRKATDNAPVVVITAFGDLETAVAAVRGGASDYLTKPFRLEDAIHVCRQAMEKSAHRNAPVAVQAMSTNHDSIVGASPAMQWVFRQIALVADSDLSVLITGETGTGKELVAAAIHRHSRRAEQPYIPIAPITLNPDVIESELFGHVKGAFTGADEDRAGLFEQAQSGTVLLDEIGDLPLALQAKLLRVLEQGQYFRVGDVRPRQANVRILAATHCNLNDAVRAGEFREDLFHRMTGVQIHLPPLRERRDDIELLCQHFLQSMQYPDAESAIDATLRDDLKQRAWHGNVRELKSATEHAAVVARGRALRLSDFPPPKPSRNNSVSTLDGSLEKEIRVWALAAIEKQSSKSLPLHAQFLSTTEPALLKVAIEHTGGNRAKAAELLGIHRGTLRDRLRAYKIDEGTLP